MLAYHAEVFSNLQYTSNFAKENTSPRGKQFTVYWASEADEDFLTQNFVLNISYHHKVLINLYNKRYRNDPISNWDWGNSVKADLDLLNLINQFHWPIPAKHKYEYKL